MIKKISNIRLNSNYPIGMISSIYWQATSSSGEFKLSSCCDGIGFDFKYFEMLRNLDPFLRQSKTIQKLI